MPRPMPSAEVPIDEDLVRRLLASQFPQWESLPLRATSGIGWDNAMFRLGEDLAVRLPRRELAATLVVHEQRWLPELAPALPVPVPVPVGHGRPALGYPWHWSVCPWLPGEPAATAAMDDHERLARELGRFLKALHVPAPSAAPRSPWRGTPLRDRDESFRQTLPEIEGLDHPTLLAVWEEGLAASPWSSSPVWVHGDLHPANLLIERGQLSGVVDWGDVTAGDPASDIAVAWMLLPASSRVAFYDEAGVDDATRVRARAWAALLGCVMLANSADNDVIAGIGAHTVAAVHDEVAG